MSLFVGLTGGIGSGKTFVAELFRKKFVHVISADFIARELVQPERQAWKEIVEIFGHKILLENGEIHRAKLGKIIFDDSEKRKTLESILHPKIINEEKRIYKEICSEDPLALVILEAALLIESGNYKNLDRLIVVSCHEEERIFRLIQRDNLSRHDIIKRMKAQMRMDDKAKYADYILCNEGPIKDLEKQVNILYEKLKSQV